MNNWERSRGNRFGNPRTSRGRRSAWAVSLAALLTSASAHAQWIGAGAGGAGTEISTAANWVGGTVNGNFTTVSSNATLSLTGGVNFSPNFAFGSGLSLGVGDGVAVGTLTVPNNAGAANLALSLKTAAATTVTFSSTTTLLAQADLNINGGTGSGARPVLIINGPLNLNGNRFNHNAGDVTINGLITGNGAGSFRYGFNNIANADPGVLTVTNPANSFTNPINSAGAGAATLNVASTLPIANSGVPSAIGAGTTINFNNSTINLSGQSAAVSTDRAIVLANSGRINNNGSNTVTLTGNVTSTSSTATFTLGGSFSGVNAVTGLISTPMNLSVQQGTWSVTNDANSFVGNVSAGGGGQLRFSSIANVGTNSSLGAGSATGTITINNGSMAFVGTAPQASNRAFAFVNGGDLYNNAGSTSATLTLSGPATINASNWTMTLRGSNTGANEYSGLISGTGNLSKSDGGNWLVSNDASSFTGNVFVGAGQLRFTSIGAIGANSSLGASSATGGIQINNASMAFVGTAPQTSNRSFAFVNGADLYNNASSSSATLTLSGPATINASNWSMNLRGSNTGVSEYSGLISGTGNLGKFDNGTWRVSNAANSFTGNISAWGGFLQFTSVADIGVNSSLGASDVSKNISINNGSLVFVGSSAQSTNRTFAYANTGNLYNNATDPAATLAITGTSSITNTGWSMVLRGSNAGDNVVSGTISGAGNLVKSDGGRWTVNNPANSFTGGVFAQGGDLYFTSIGNYGDASSLGTGGTNSVIQINNGNLRFSGTTPQSSNRAFETYNWGQLYNNASDPAATLTLSGPFTINGSNGILWLKGNNTGNNVISGPISGDAQVIKDDNGTWTLSNATSTFNNSIFVNSGFLRFTSIANYGSPSSLGTGGTSSNIQINNGNLVFVGTAPQSSNRNFVLVNNGNLVNNASDPAASLNLSGNASIPGGGWSLNLNGSNTGSNIYSGVISGVGNLSKNEGGSWTVNNPNSSFTGNVFANSGQLRFTTVGNYGVNSSLGTGGTSSIIQVNNGSLVFVGSSAQSTNRSIAAVNTANIQNNATDNAATLTLAGPVSINASNWTLSLGGSNPGTNALSSTVSGLITGPGKIFKGGLGTWLLSNDANSFQGEVNVGGGILRFTSIGLAGQPSSLGTGGTTDNPIPTVLNNGALSFVGTSAQTTDRPFYVFNTGDLTNDAANPASTLNITDFSYFFFASGSGTLRLGGSNTGDNTIAGAIFSTNDGAGGFSKIGSGKWILTSPYNNFGSPTLSGGTVEVPSINNQGIAGPLGVGTDINLNNGTLSVASATAQSTNRTINLNQGGAVAANGTSPAATLTLTGTIKSEGNSGTLTFTGSNTGANTISGTLRDGGRALAVAKAGVGTWTFTGNATYSGPTSVTGGEYRVANSGNGNAFGTGTVSVGSGSSLVIDRTDDLTVPNALSGAGSFTKSNTNTLTLTGNNTLSGTVTVSSGTLSVSNTGAANALGTASVSLGSGSTLELARSDAYTVPGNISGAGSLRVSSGSSATLTGSLTYSGNTTVLANSTLTVQQPLRPVTGSLVVTGQGATINLSSPGSPSGYTVTGEFSSITVGGNGQSSTSKLVVEPNNRAVNKPHVLLTNSLTIGDSGFIDLGYNDLIIRGGVANLAAIRSYVQSWYNTGTTGLGSNYANPFGADYTTIAVFPNTTYAGVPYFQQYDGIPLTASDVIVKFTYVGDVNLDGVLDGQDARIIQEGYLFGATGWENGDVDYANVGTVSIDDLNAFNDAYNYFLTNNLPSLGDGTGSTASIQSIPEPGSALLASLGAVGLISRRRRR